MHKIKTAILFFILASSLISGDLTAQRLIKGEVRSSTGELIPYATIAVNQTKNLSDSRGKFSLNLQSYSGQDTVFFSCIGFDPAKLLLSTVESQTVITLQKRSFLLNEVIISAKGKFETIKLGNTGSNLFNKLLSRVNDQYALFIGNNGGTGIIRTVSYFVKEPPGGSHDGAFRVRIYSVNKLNGEPGKDLLLDNLIVNAKRKNAWFSVDVSKYHIRMPDDGVFVAMEILPSDQYKTGSTVKSGLHYVNTLKMPCLGLNQALDKPNSWLKNDFSRGWRDWRLLNSKDAKPSNLMININVSTFSGSARLSSAQ